MRTIPGMKEYLKPLDEMISNTFIPALLQSIITEKDRKIYSLPVRFGGLGIPLLLEIAEQQYEASTAITAPLVSIMIIQGNSLPDEKNVHEIKLETRKREDVKLMTKIAEVEQEIPSLTLRAIQDAKNPGASSWLTVLPLEEYGFVLNKGEFRDAVNLRYGKHLRGLPSKCTCGQVYDVTHALNCKKGGFVIIRHNKIRDFEASLLKKVVSDVETEPQLQQVDGEILDGLTGDNAKPDIRARGVWRDGQNAYFDVRVTNTNSASQCHMTTEKILEKHEREKKRQYNRRIMNIENGTLTPLVFSVNGGMGKECSMYHKHIAEKISTKTEERYEKVLSMIRCKLSFIILRACLMCIRGSRSSSKMKLTNLVLHTTLQGFD